MKRDTGLKTVRRHESLALSSVSVLYVKECAVSRPGKCRAARAGHRQQRSRAGMSAWRFCTMDLGRNGAGRQLWEEGVSGQTGIRPGGPEVSGISVKTGKRGPQSDL